MNNHKVRHINRKKTFPKMHPFTRSFTKSYVKPVLHKFDSYYLEYTPVVESPPTVLYSDHIETMIRFHIHYQLHCHLKLAGLRAHAQWRDKPL